MILQRLNEFYDHLLEDGKVEPFGIERRNIPYIIELDSDGTPISIIETTKDKHFNVPMAVKRAANIEANLLYDNIEYVLGVPKPDAKEKQKLKVPGRHEAFTEKIKSLPPEVQEDEGVQAVLRFLDRKDIPTLESMNNWDEMYSSGGYISFQLAEDVADLVCERYVVRNYAITEAESPQDASIVTCLISGEEGPLARLHPLVKGVKGKEAQTGGTNITSFNSESFESYGWRQGANAPICGRSAFGYTAALSYLLSGDSDHSLREGDTYFIFWAEQNDKAKLIKEAFVGWGDDEESEKGSPDRVKKTIRSVRGGLQRYISDQTSFYILSVAPNASRLEVRSWFEGTVGEFAKAISRHFEDLSIIGYNEDDEPVPSIWRLLGAASRDSDPKKLAPERLRGNLAADIIRAALQGTPYPAKLLSRTVVRCQTETERRITHMRAALIKAVLNRNNRLSGSQKEITVDIDLENRNTGYVLGRLFAVLRKIQEDSSKSPNTTILDRYFSSASTCPRASFAHMMRLKEAHLKKLRRDNMGYAVRNEKIMAEIMSKLDSDDPFPSYLSLEDQGRFIVGYHHQTNDLYRKKVNTEEDSSEAEDDAGDS